MPSRNDLPKWARRRNDYAELERDDMRRALEAIAALDMNGLPPPARAAIQNAKELLTKYGHGQTGPLTEVGTGQDNQPGTGAGSSNPGS